MQIKLILFLSIFIFSCKKVDIESLESELPTQTTSGLNTFGCLIDNKVWIPKIDRDLAVFTQETKLTLDKKTGSIFIEATAIYKDTNLKNIREIIQLNMKGISEPGTYTLVPFNIENNFPAVSGLGFFSQEGILDKFSGTYRRNLTTGEYLGKPKNLNVKITKLDFDNKVCSGTFEFDAFAFFTSISIDEVKIKKGRFDLKAK